MQVIGAARVRGGWIVAMAAGAVLVACGGGGGGPTPPPEPPITISIAPTSVNLNTGSTGSLIATLKRGSGYTSDVSLALSGAPANVSLLASPPTLTGSTLTSVISVSVAPAAVAGTYTITLTASGANANPSTVTFQLTVTSQNVGTAVTLSYCTADAPLWFAYQDGAGAWTRVTPNAGTNTYQFTASSGRVGIAAVDTVATGYALRVTYATPAELNGFAGAPGFTGCVSKRVNGSMLNSSPGSYAQISLGESTKNVSAGAGSVSFVLDSVAAGPLDLIATRVQSSRRVDRMILRRNQDIANNGTMAPLDFTGAESFAAGSANVTVSGLGADTAFVTTIFQGVRGKTFGFLTTRIGYTSATGAVPYDAVPVDRLGANDIQQLYAVTTQTASRRFANVFFRGPVDRTLTLGPALSAPTVSRITGGAYSRAGAQWTVQAEYNRYASAEFSQPTINRLATIAMTSGYLAGATSWNLTIPDLSAASGWLATWGPQAGTAIAWNVYASGGAQFLLDATIADGATARSGQVYSQSPLP